MSRLRGPESLEDIEPIAIAAYIEELGSEIAKPSVKQHLAAIRQLFDYLADLIVVDQPGL